MLIAAPVFRSTISPVFDVAQTILIATIVDGCETARKEISLNGLGPRRRVALLAREGTDALICGAITSHSQQLVETVGIRIHPGIAGDVEQVLFAFCRNRLDRADFRMPGCCRKPHFRGRGRRFIDRR